MLTILHFADAHIDMANYGRHDPETGLPLRVMDFLKSLDTIVDAAIQQEVDLVLFAGDTFKDRNPAPTFQREWGKRIMRLSRAGIPTLLLVGNHDISPALFRAHALDAFSTLDVPNVYVADKPKFYTPDDLGGLPVQIIALPWISRSGMMAQMEIRGNDPQEVYQRLEESLSELVNGWLEEADPDLPIVLTAHASVQGAAYGNERTVMLGGDLVLSPGLVKNKKFSYVALGHIHKPQNLNEGNQPPVIYPGSIERVDFGEVDDDKFYVIAEIEKGKDTNVEWRQLTEIRPFIDRYLELKSKEDITAKLLAALPPSEELADAIVRLTLEYPRDWEALIDESALQDQAASAFEFRLVKRPQMESRVRLPEDQTMGELTPLELLEVYWKAAKVEPEEMEALQKLAGEIIEDAGE